MGACRAPHPFEGVLRPQEGHKRDWKTSAPGTTAQSLSSTGQQPLWLSRFLPGFKPRTGGQVRDHPEERSNYWLPGRVASLLSQMAKMASISPLFIASQFPDTPLSWIGRSLSSPSKSHIYGGLGLTSSLLSPSCHLPPADAQASLKGGIAAHPPIYQLS